VNPLRNYECFQKNHRMTKGSLPLARQSLAQ
jgi:hypothetical protein